MSHHMVDFIELFCYNDIYMKYKAEKYQPYKSEAGDDPRRPRWCISCRLFHLWLGNVNLHDKFDKYIFCDNSCGIGLLINSVK